MARQNFLNGMVGKLKRFTDKSDESASVEPQVITPTPPGVPIPYPNTAVAESPDRSTSTITDVDDGSSKTAMNGGSVSETSPLGEGDKQQQLSDETKAIADRSGPDDFQVDEAAGTGSQGGKPGLDNHTIEPDPVAFDEADATFGRRTEVLSPEPTEPVETPDDGAANWVERDDGIISTDEIASTDGVAEDGETTAQVAGGDAAAGASEAITPSNVVAGDDDSAASMATGGSDGEDRGGEILDPDTLDDEFIIQLSGSGSSLSEQLRETAVGVGDMHDLAPDLADVDDIEFD